MKHRYLFGLLLGLVCASLYFFHVIYSEVKEKTISDLNSRQLIHARQAGRGIEEYFSDLIIFLTKVSESGHIISLDDQGRKEMDFALKTNREEIKAITRVDERGRILYTLPYDGAAIGRDISYQKHIREIMMTRKPVVSDVFTAIQGYNAVALHVPVFKGNEYRGTLAFLINFQAISRKFLEDIRIGETGYAWMISRDGIELYCPVPGHTGKSVFENCKDFPTIISMAKEMVKSRQGVTTYLFDQIRDQKTVTVKKQAVYLPVKVGDSFWSIVVASSEDEVLASLESFRNKLIFVIGFLLLCSAIISFYGMKAWVIVREEAKRQKAEDALRESEARLNKSQAIAHLGSWTLELSTNRLIWSDEVYRIFGLRPEEFTATYDVFLDAVHPEDRAVVDAAYSGSLKEGKDSYEIDHRIIRRDTGEIRYVHEKCEHEKDASGKIIRSVGMVHDITERKRAEEALHENEERFRSMIQSLSDMIFILDRNGQLTYESPSTSQILGYQPGYFIGKSPFINIHHDDLDKIIKAMEEVVQSVNPGIPTQFRYRKSDDTWCYLEAIGSNQFENPSIKGIVLTVRDITERKRAEDALVQSERKYRMVLETNPDPMIVYDMEGKVIYLNPAFTSVFGWSLEERIRKKLDDFVPDESWPETRMMIDMVIAGKEFSGIETRRLTKEGKVIPVSISGSCFRNQEGNIEVSVINLRNIARLKQAEEEKTKLEEQYRQAQKMEAIGQLAGGIAHDFNNMLNIILGYSQMALMKIEPSSPLHGNIQEIVSAGKRSADLVRQLLAFARKQTIAPKVLDLNDAVSGMLNMLRKLIGEDIDLLWMPAANLWQVKMDPAQVDQILANLAVNARDSISGVGKITIETVNAEFDEDYCARHAGFVPGQYVLIAVSDNGCGMDKKTLDKIFEPFFTTKESGKGTGMGLATVYGIVKQNNGFINVYSEPGTGTTFKIYVPRSNDEWMTIDEPRQQGGHMTGTETVLLVEDDESLLKMAETMLEELGYEVLTACSPGEAIQLAEQYTGHIHLLTTDVVMPEMSGRNLQKRISAIRPGIKCLFMSGYTANVIAHRGILDEGVNFLQKPFSMIDMSTRIREALEK
jgi:PAS domain S-box-containing protein